MKQDAKKIYIRTFGCQMNDRDSEAVLGLFLAGGYKEAASPEAADIILVNTCSVRDHAENRAISFLGSLKKIAESGKGIADSENIKNKKLTADRLPLTAKPIIGLIGCMARNRGEELFEKMQHIDLICGPSSLDNISTYIEKIKNEGQRILDIADKRRAEIFYKAAYRTEKDHAQVVISTGCSNECSYCVVPFVRGPLRPRVPRDILDEVKRNVSMGITRITLLGQNVNDYMIRSHIPGFRSKRTSFVDLLKMIERIDGLKELDFITSHPKNTSMKLFNAMASSKKIKKHLHLPFQSGSDKILRLMERDYTKARYLKLAEAFKNIVGGTLSTDVIVGFPEETHKDFTETKEMLEKVRFRHAYIFKYSPRPHTKALQLKDTVSKEVKEKRHQLLLERQRKISNSLKKKL